MSRAFQLFVPPVPFWQPGGIPYVMLDLTQFEIDGPITLASIYNVAQGWWGVDFEMIDILIDKGPEDNYLRISRRSPADVERRKKLKAMFDSPERRGHRRYHDESEQDEVFVCNCKSAKQFAAIPLKHKRKGKRAYDEHGKPLPKKLFPAFGTWQELMDLGVSNY